MVIAEHYYRAAGHTPFPHQKKCWRALSQGRAVVVRAPTGSGKTKSVVLPFCAFRGRNLPGRMIYALPLRSLANQIAAEIRKCAEKTGSGAEPLRVCLQHGEAPESVLFYGDAVAATVDQVITSYACSPLTLPVRHGNVPAGAVAGSFLVFDEVHLFDPRLALQSVRLICGRLNRMGLPYAVLSATLPDSVLDLWQKELGAEVVEAHEEPVRRQVEVRWWDSSLGPEEVVGALERAERVLAVCNTAFNPIMVRLSRGVY